MHDQATARLRRRVLAGLLSLAAGSTLAAADDRYLVEVLVFRHVDADASAVPATELRDFNGVFALDEPMPPETPSPTADTGQTFQNLWARLRRVGGYEPLAMSSWTQSQVDYQPPVRLHDAEVIAEELRLPGPVFWSDAAGGPLLQEYQRTLFRLDGSVQLRRSRFLHIDLDLEYREHETAMPTAPLAVGPAPATQIPAVGDDAEPLPFRVHHLRQSRQVKTGEIHYFDTAFLGALVRVTPLEGG